jgi:2-desacetyl-2-hydroxyethyl bacteriochlorophyllide A dehydrogenase
MPKIPAIVFRDANAVGIEEFPRPTCAPGTLLCRTRYSTISPGTELRTLRGEQQGARFPLIPGYAWVGQVEDIAADVTGFAPGDWVCGRASAPFEGMGSTWGGHAAFHATPVSGYAAAVKLPSQANPLDYVLTELAAIAWRGVSMCLPSRNETAVVCGQGIIGALATLWLLQAGVRVVAVELDATRLERACRLGALTVDGRAKDATAEVKALTGGPVDIAVEASASMAGARLVASLLRWPHAFNQAISYRPDEGAERTNYWPRLCLLASYTQTLELPPAGLIETEGALVLRPRDRRVADRCEIVERTRKGLLRVADFVEPPRPFSEAPELYRQLRDEPAKALTFILAWP